MKRVVCLLAILAATAAAAAKPNFSGDWKLNPAKSALGPIPPPTSFTRKVTHAEPELTVADDQKGGAGDQSYTRTYTTDGREITYQANGAEIKASATWDGDAIVIRSNADAGGTTLVITERMALSNGDKTLTDGVHIVTPQSEIDITYIFDKQ